MAKRLWNVLRIALYMIRKGGVVSKRKLMVDMNLMMKRGRILRKSLGNLMFHHRQHSSKDATSATNNYYYTSTGGFGMSNHYEYSCSNSPNPVLFHISRRKHHYFPCINAPSTCDVDDELVVDQYLKKAVVAIEYSSPAYDHDHGTYNYSSFRFATPDLAPGEKLSPLLKSPFSAVRISNYSSEDDEFDDVKDYKAQQVDEDAEEFIRKFYEQLSVQSGTHSLQY
ncbi:hypothetical protein Sjap_023157 [Stephania japonica]|uniref:Uncharacterized protein n=1 Tax=Stephania japonica TaxID=461633 RepID=A0AAP0EB44_9MAGN